jgi:hypothetical protein
VFELSVAFMARGLLAQVLAAAIVLTIAAAHVELAHATLAPAWLAGVHGAAALGLSRRLDLPRRWQAIMAGFVPALWLAQQASVSAWIWLAALVLLLLIYGGTFRGQVPLFLSGSAAHQVLIRLLPEHADARVFDMGAGIGSALAAIAARRPDVACSGMEWAPLPWLLGKLRWWMCGLRVDWRCRDYWQEDLGRYDLVYAYLSPAAMSRLAEKAKAQMRPGSRLVSYRFEIPGLAPDEIHPVGSGQHDRMYVWRF